MCIVCKTVKPRQFVVVANCDIIFLMVSVVEARVGGGSQEAGGGTYSRTRHSRGLEEPEHCRDNSH